MVVHSEPPLWLTFNTWQNCMVTDPLASSLLIGARWSRERENVLEVMSLRRCFQTVHLLSLTKAGDKVQMVCASM